MKARLVVCLLVTACGASEASAPEVEAPPPDAATPVDAFTADAPDVPDASVPVDAAPPCVEIDDKSATVIAHAPDAAELGVLLPAASASTTRWSESGNEALVLEVAGATRGFIGHLVLHQGRATFDYGMYIGRLVEGEAITLRVSPLSAAAAERRACVGRPTFVHGGAGLTSAPVFRWPVGKRFDDLPVLVGWSESKRSYQAVYTSENGGTVRSCGGGAKGMQAEIARWGRGCDIERIYTSGATPSWGRCTGSSTTALRYEGEHPIFYYGDGHNRLFENRGGYGRTCGGGASEKADGDLPGWNVDNPGNGEENDAPHVITQRPLPVALDPLGYAAFNGRREALLDVYAPWVYRLTFLELEREGKIDGARTFPIDRYLYVDVHAADVDGSGDRECTSTVSSGFMVRAVPSGGAVQTGPQMTASYFGAAEDWKRVAVPLDRAYAATEISGLVFDAYDNDGIYLLGVGSAFVVRPEGENGARLDYVRTGEKTIGVYVDDDRSGCVNGVNSDGPGHLPAACVGSDYAF